MRHGGLEAVHVQKCLAHFQVRLLVHISQGEVVQQPLANAAQHQVFRAVVHLLQARARLPHPRVKGVKHFFALHAAGTVFENIQVGATRHAHKRTHVFVEVHLVARDAAVCRPCKFRRAYAEEGLDRLKRVIFAPCQAAAEHVQRCKGVRKRMVLFGGKRALEKRSGKAHAHHGFLAYRARHAVHAYLV